MKPLKIMITLFVGMGILWFLITFNLTATVRGETVGMVSNEVMHRYDVPFSNGAPQNLIVEPGSNPVRIWFTMPAANAIGRLVVTSTTNYQFSQYAVGGSQPFDLAYDPTRDWVWFTMAGSGSIGYFDVASPGTITEIDIVNDHNPAYIDVAPNGDVWFTEPDANHLTRYQHGIGFAEFTSPISASMPTHVAVQANDSIWFTAPPVNYAIEYDPIFDNFNIVSVTDFGLPSFPPGALAVDSSKPEPWIAAPTMSRIGVYSPGTLALWRWYSFPVVNSGINSLDHTTLSGQELWFTMPDAGRVGRMELTASYKLIAFGQAQVSAGASRPVDIVVDGAGTAWIADAGTATIGQWVAPYFNQVHLPLVIKE